MTLLRNGNAAMTPVLQLGNIDGHYLLCMHRLPAVVAG